MLPQVAKGGHSHILSRASLDDPNSFEDIKGAIILPKSGNPVVVQLENQATGTNPSLWQQAVSTKSNTKLDLVITNLPLRHESVATILSGERAVAEEAQEVSNDDAGGSPVEELEGDITVSREVNFLPPLAMPGLVSQAIHTSTT